MSEKTQEIDLAALAAPFPADVIGWKAQTARENRALAVAYIDSRDVMDRLDAIVGPANWQDSYTVEPDGCVRCKLSLRIGEEWITKEDVGGESDQADEGDKRKAAFSDALKRAAVKWGIGRYLYRLPAQWVDYDPKKKQIVGTPKLPPEALPAPTAVRQGAASAGKKNGDPTNAAELMPWLERFDAQLHRAGLITAKGALVTDVLRHCDREEFPDDVENWNKDHVTFAVKEAKGLAAEARALAERRKQKDPQPAA